MCILMRYVYLYSIHTAIIILIPIYTGTCIGGYNLRDLPLAVKQTLLAFEGGEGGE